MRRVLPAVLALIAMVTIVGAQDKGKGGGGKGGGKGGFSLPPTIQVTIEGVANGQFPAANAGQGKSPKISWTQVPAGTQAFALLMHDPEPVIGNDPLQDVTH